MQAQGADVAPFCLVACVSPPSIPASLPVSYLVYGVFIFSLFLFSHTSLLLCAGHWHIIDAQNSSHPEGTHRVMGIPLGTQLGAKESGGQHPPPAPSGGQGKEARGGFSDTWSPGRDGARAVLAKEGHCPGRGGEVRQPAKALLCSQG